MRKGYAGYQIVGVFSNLGSGAATYTLTLTSGETGFGDSETAVEILSCQVVTTDGSGNLEVSMAEGLPRVFYPKAQLAGSGVCSL